MHSTLIAGRVSPAPAQRQHAWEEDYASYSLAEWTQLPREVLVLTCDLLGVSSAGRVSILASRLFRHYAPPTVARASTSAAQGSVSAWDISSLRAMKKRELQQLCTQNGIPVSGTKDALALRLYNFNRFGRGRGAPQCTLSVPPSRKRPYRSQFAEEDDVDVSLGVGGGSTL